MSRKSDDMVVTVAAVSVAVTLIIILLSSLPWITEAFELTTARAGQRAAMQMPAGARHQVPGLPLSDTLRPA